MSNQQHTVLVRTAVRQRRERLSSIIAAATLVASWYLSAALDVRHEHEYAHQQRAAPSAFDAAFAAANSRVERRAVECVDASCATQLAQAAVLQAQL